MPKHAQRFWVAALVAAWAVDFLFWKKPAGISFLIFIVLILAAGYALAYFEKVRAHRSSLILSGLVLVLAGITVLRSEMFTRGLNILLALTGLALLVMTFRSGAWSRFRTLDYITAALELFVVGLVRAASLRLFPDGKAGAGRREFEQKAVPVLRGLLLALPVVLVLTALLASADLVFADQLNGLLKNFNLALLPEYLFRLFYILVPAYLFAGLYLQAVLPTRWGASAAKDAQPFAQPGESAAPHDAEAPDSAVTPGGASVPEGAKTPDGIAAPVAALAKLPAERGMYRFLGATEAFVVLGSVNLLFAFFVAIQFRYFFGGQANITAAGYTYSEYARRGFFELVLVAVISLLLYLALNSVTRREKPVQVRAFTGLSVLLVGLVWVILASAFQRLLLYEAVYGFTSLRTYTHIFIPWLGFLLLATIALQIFHREQFFGGLLLLTTFGFALTFGVLSVDDLIVRQNVARARAGADLDGQYLVGLSTDAVPALVSEFTDPNQPQAVRDELGAVLSCRIYIAAHPALREEPQPWQSVHFGQAAANQQLLSLDLGAYQTQKTAEGTYVLHKDQQFDCFPKRGLD